MFCVEIYTDGSCIGNPGPGGWAAILQYQGEEKVLSGSKSNTMAIEMELVAVLEGLRGVTFASEINVHTDSALVIGWLSGRYRRKSTRYAWLLSEIDWLIRKSGHRVFFTKVKAHSGNLVNGRCDRLARQIARELHRNISGCLRDQRKIA